MSLRNPNEKVQFNQDALKTIYIAGGCFWGVDAYFKHMIS